MNPSRLFILRPVATTLLMAAILLAVAFIPQTTTATAVNFSVDGLASVPAPRSDEESAASINLKAWSPDTPYLKQYKIDYLNMSRDTTSNVSIATQIATAARQGSNDSSAETVNNRQRIAFLSPRPPSYHPPAVTPYAPPCLPRQWRAWIAGVGGMVGRVVDGAQHLRLIDAATGVVRKQFVLNLPKDRNAEVTQIVFSSDGMMVAVLVDETQSAGKSALFWGAVADTDLASVSFAEPLWRQAGFGG